MIVRDRSIPRPSLTAKLQQARRDGRNRRLFRALGLLAGTALAVVYILFGGMVVMAASITLHDVGLPWPRIGYVDSLALFALFFLLVALLRGPRP